MILQYILFALLCMAIVLVVFLPEMIYLILKKKSFRIGSFKLIDMILIILGVLSGIAIYIIIQNIE